MSDAADTGARGAVAEAVAPIESAVAESNGEAQEIAKTIPNLEQTAKDMRKKFKLKVDGREEDFDIDLGNEEELVKQFQLSKVAQKRMAEAAGMKKDVDQLAKMLLSDPETILEQLGMDVDKMAEQRIARRLEELQKSPDQRAREELERKVKEYEGKLSKAESERQAAAESQFQQEEASKINSQIESAIAKYPDLPRTPYTLERIARYMIAEMDNGNESVSVEDVLAKVKRDSDFELKQRVNALSEAEKYEMIEELIGKDILEKMRKKRLAQNRATPATSTSVQSTGESERRQTSDKKPKEKVPLKNFLRGLGNR